MRLVIKKFNIILSVFIVVASSVIGTIYPVSSNVHAVGCDTSFYSDNDIAFFAPEGCDTSCSNINSSSLLGAGNLPSTTVSYLEASVSIKSKIETNKARYLYAESQTGIEWQAIAALHFREANLDPDKSILNGSLLGSGIDESSGLNIPADPNEDAKQAANYLKEVALNVYGLGVSSLNKSSSGAQWGKAFLAYHGGASFINSGVDYTQSTYVVNGLDPETLDMSWIGGDLEPESGVDSKKAGALTVLKYLGGIEESSVCAGYGAVAGNIVQTGINLSKKSPVSDKVLNSDAEPSYISTFNSVNGRNPVEYPPGSDNENEVTSCSLFVSVVMRSSKSDLDFPENGTWNILPYLKGSNKYTDVTNRELLPGDILIFIAYTNSSGQSVSGHTMIYTGNNGPYLAIQASLGSQVPNVRLPETVEWMKKQPGYSAWRLNG